MKSEKDILLEKMNKALQKRDYVKVTQIKTQLDNLNKYELIPVKDLFGNMTKEQNEPMSPQYFKELFRVSKNQIIWGANHFITRINKDSPCWIVWDKDNGANDFADCELAFTSFPNAVRKFKYRWHGMLQENMKNKEIRIHPTQKPVDLYAYLLKTFAKEGDKIFDSHLGSGSSRIAAYKLGFDFYGCEIDKEYFASANERFENECLGIVQTKNGVLTQQKLF